MNASALSISLTAVLALPALSCRRAAPTSTAPASPPTPAPTVPPAPEPVIVGTVIDSFGHPIQGATLSIRDSAFRAATNEQGEFSLTFAPGLFRVTAEAPGCLPHSRDLQLTQAVRYPLGPTMLVRIPDLPRETVVVATEQGYRPLPATELERRVINFGSAYAAFPGRCAVFSLQRDVPILRGSVLFVVSPDEHFQLVRVEDLHVTTDSYPGSVGQCPGVPQGARVVATRKGTMPERTFFLSTTLQPGSYCFVRSPRVHPEAPESSQGYCFEWEVDPSRRFGASMSEPREEPGAPPEQLNDVDDHGA